jgi:sodium-dependent dicarboxylate transporter 2/3/5
MMLPIALSVIHLAKRTATAEAPLDPNLPVALLLAVAYSASIGGVSTLIGTPPNALLAAFMLETHGVQIGFGQWMLFGVPLILVSLPICWILLTRVTYPLGRREIAGGAEMIRRELAELGPPSRAEKIVGVTAVVVALSWIFRPLAIDAIQDLAGEGHVSQVTAQVVAAISDEGIAILGALALFIIPVNWRRGEFALDWKQAERLPWGVLILFGGGLSLADAIQSTGLAGWIGDSLSALSALPLWVVAIAVTAVILFLTELTSNTATAAAFLPVVASLATGMRADPLALAVPAAVAATCAFMLPVGTPPNALVFSSGQVSIPQMMWAGFWLNLIMVVTINLAMFFLGELVFGELSGALSFSAVHPIE